MPTRRVRSSARDLVDGDGREMPLWAVIPTRLPDAEGARGTGSFLTRRPGAWRRVTTRLPASTHHGLAPRFSRQICCGALVTILLSARTSEG